MGSTDTEGFCTAIDFRESLRSRAALKKSEFEIVDHTSEVRFMPQKRGRQGSPEDAIFHKEKALALRRNIGPSMTTCAF